MAVERTFFDDIVGEFDPGREVCDLLKSTDTSKVRYVADFCALLKSTDTSKVR